MSEKSLPDELRSVLLAHSYDAPGPDDTVARTLAETVEVNTIGSHPFGSHPRRRWHPSISTIAGVAALIAVGIGGGVVGLQHRSQNATSSRSAGSETVAGSNGADAKLAPNSALTVEPNSTAGPNSAFSSSTDTFSPRVLSCAARQVVMTGFASTVEIGDQKDPVIVTQCADAAGERETSEVYTSGTVNSKPATKATLIQQSEGLAVESLTTGPSEITVRFLRLATARTPQTLEQKTFRTSDGGFTYQVTAATVIAPACDVTELASTVVPAVADGTAILQVRNTGTASCELGGYPTIGRSSKSLRGEAGGTSGFLAPIVVLDQGQTASAAIDPPAHAVPCPTNLKPAQIALPDGAKLTGTSWQATISCIPAVHPFVAGTTGSD